MATFWAALENFGLFFIPTSGNTVSQRESNHCPLSHEAIGQPQVRSLTNGLLNITKTQAPSQSERIVS